jgi:heat shock protein HslJ
MPLSFLRAPTSRASSRFQSCLATFAAAAFVAGCALPQHPDTAAPPTDPYNPAATQLLDDTQWALTRWTDASGRPRTLPQVNEDNQGSQALTLDFSTESGRRRASGFSGCNRFSGEYSLKNGKLAFGPLAGTRMACATGMGAALEQPYLDGLAHVAKSGVQMNPPQALELTLDNGDVLIFTRRAK